MNYLKDTDLTICEIAERMRFSDDSNIRRAFKKWTGTSSSELREDIPLASGGVRAKPLTLSGTRGGSPESNSKQSVS